MIPHGIDTGVFAPGDRAEARQRFGLPEQGLVVAFMASGAQLPRKGYALLREAVEHLTDSHRFTLFTVGGRRPVSPAGMSHLHLGSIGPRISS
jgi:hypothetical protein